MMVFVGFRPWIGYGGTTSNTDELCGFGVQGVTTDLAARARNSMKVLLPNLTGGVTQQDAGLEDTISAVRSL